MKKSTVLMPILGLLMGMATLPAQADTSEACRSVSQSEPWPNHPTHLWNVVWRNQRAACQTPSVDLKQSKEPIPATTASQAKPLSTQPSATHSTDPSAPILVEEQPTPQPVQ